MKDYTEELVNALLAKGCQEITDNRSKKYRKFTRPGLPFEFYWVGESELRIGRIVSGSLRIAYQTVDGKVKV